MKFSSKQIQVIYQQSYHHLRFFKEKLQNGGFTNYWEVCKCLQAEESLQRR
jgi:hypothetical protein